MEIRLDYPVGSNVFLSTIIRGMQEGSVREGDVMMEGKVAVMWGHKPPNAGYF